MKFFEPAPKILGALAAFFFGAQDIDAVFVSHLHSDHVGGLEWLGFSLHFARMQRPTLFISGLMKNRLWNESLKGGMESLENQETSLATYFDARAFAKNAGFFWEGKSFQPVQVMHVISEYSIEPALGLIFDLNGRQAFITCDTQFAPSQIKAYYEKADVIFHDCETAPFKSGAHAHFEDLKTLPAWQKAKMRLCHYQDGAPPDAQAAGFAGFVEKGESFF